jgi:hypothetical protein
MRRAQRKHAGRAAARAELEAVTAEVMLIVRQLDALNRFRFRSDAESLAGWKSARDVAWPAPPTPGEVEKPAARRTGGRMDGWTDGRGGRNG